MELALAGKVAVITGGGGDLGRATALQFAKEDARVVVADYNTEQAHAVAAAVTEHGAEALAIQVDVTSSSQIADMVSDVLERFGSIDILINNAGILGPQRPLADFDEAGWHRVIDVNLNGVFLCSKAILPHMIEKQYGKIVNVSSIAGKTGEPFNTAYSATKAAIINLTQALALEVAPFKINVNAVCPAGLGNAMSKEAFAERSAYLGITPDEFRQRFLSSFPLPIPLTVDDVAKTMVFLSSDMSVQITGEAVNVTGGVEVH